MMTPLLGFAPDADPTTPGVLQDCANLIPFNAGFMGCPAPLATTAAALAAPARGATVATKLDGTRRIFAGTQTKLYELNGTAWTDRSAGTYTGSTESRWSFAQFGDTTLASNLADAMQQSTTGAFAAVPTAPRAKIIVSASNNFVIAFNTIDGTFGVQPDRWWTSAQSNQADWVPSVATGSVTGRLVAREGAIQAALPLGDYVVAYKSRGVFLGSFVGASSGGWQWPLVPGSECGAVGPEAVCDIGDAHFIVGEDEFWIFDGTRPVPVSEGICRDWFRANSSQTFRYRTKVNFDRQRNLVWIQYPSQASTGECDSVLAYHVGKKRFGRANVVVQAALNFSAPGVTINGLDAYASTIDGLPAIPFDSQYWLAGGRLYGYFNSANQLVTRTGVAAASSLTTWDAALDDETVSSLGPVRLRFLQQPASAIATGLSFMNEGENQVLGPNSPMTEGKFDIWQGARFHSVRFDLMGDHRETAANLPLLPLAGR